MFGCIWQCFITTRNLLQNGLNWCNWCTSLCREVVLDFFATNAPDPLHCTLNSCFGASRSVWVHLAMFHYYTKLGAKRVEQVQLMHKFVPWSHFGIFRNECTRPTPLDPKLMYCCIRSDWVHFGLFCYCMKLGAKRVELVQLMQKFLPRSRIRIYHNEHTWSAPLDHKLIFVCVS